MTVSTTYFLKKLAFNLTAANETWKEIALALQAFRVIGDETPDSVLLGRTSALLGTSQATRVLSRAISPLLTGLNLQVERERATEIAAISAKARLVRHLAAGKPVAENATARHVHDYLKTKAGQDCADRALSQGLNGSQLSRMSLPALKKALGSASTELYEQIASDFFVPDNTCVTYARELLTPLPKCGESKAARKAGQNARDADAERWLERAAKMGNDEALSLLPGIARDRGRAIEAYHTADKKRLLPIAAARNAIALAIGSETELRRAERAAENSGPKARKEFADQNEHELLTIVTTAAVVYKQGKAQKNPAGAIRDIVFANTKLLFTCAQMEMILDRCRSLTNVLGRTLALLDQAATYTYVQADV